MEGQYGGVEVSETRRLRTLEGENRKLKKLLAEPLPRSLSRLSRTPVGR
jgi:hypothetical protein